MPLRVEAGEGGLLGAAGEAAPLPHLSIGQHRQGVVEHGVAVADARGAALRWHFEGVAPFEVAVGRAPRRCRHLADVAAKHVAPLVGGEELAGDVVRRRLEGGRTLRVRCHRGLRHEHGDSGITHESADCHGMARLEI